MVTVRAITCTPSCTSQHQVEKKEINCRSTPRRKVERHSPSQKPQLLQPSIPNMLRRIGMLAVLLSVSTSGRPGSADQK